MRRAGERPGGVLRGEGTQEQRAAGAVRLVERDERAEVVELGVVKVRLGKPALDADRNGSCLLGRPIGCGEGLGARCELLERRPADQIAGLEDEHARIGAGCDRLGQGAEGVGLAVVSGRVGGMGGIFCPDLTAGTFPSATRKIGRIGLPWLSFS